MTRAWVWPVIDPHVTSSFARARVHPVTGVTQAHTGTDFRAPTGTPVYAASAGVVTRSTYAAGVAGNYVRVDHGGGLWTGYSHLSARSVVIGQAVVVGQLIGLAGATGSATAPHLHFEVSAHGVKIDPVPFLTARVGGYEQNGDGDMTEDQDTMLRAVFEAIGAGGAEGGTPGGESDTLLAYARSTATAVAQVPVKVWDAQVSAADINGTGVQTHSAAAWLTVGAYRLRDLWHGIKP